MRKKQTPNSVNLVIMFSLWIVDSLYRVLSACRRETQAVPSLVAGPTSETLLVPWNTSWHAYKGTTDVRQRTGKMVVCIYGGKMMGILGEGCWGRNCQERGNDIKGGLWMRWERTWQWLKWRRRMQKIGRNGDGKSAAATFDGRSQKKKMNNEKTFI